MDMSEMFQPLIEDHPDFLSYETVPMDADSSDLSNTLRAARMLLLQCGSLHSDHTAELTQFYQSRLAPFAAFEKCRQRRELQSTVLELLCALEDQREHAVHNNLKGDEAGSSSPLDTDPLLTSSSQLSIWSLFLWYPSSILKTEPLTPIQPRSSGAHLASVMTAKEFGALNHADMGERCVCGCTAAVVKESPSVLLMSEPLE